MNKTTKAAFTEKIEFLFLSGCNNTSYKIFNLIYQRVYS